MFDVIFMIVDIGCLIAFIFFIRAENRNTKVRKEEIKIYKEMYSSIEEFERQQTNYDVNKVVKELKEFADDLDNKAFEMYRVDNYELANGLQYKAIGVRDSIDIVNEGRIDGDN